MRGLDQSKSCFNLLSGLVIWGYSSEPLSCLSFHLSDLYLYSFQNAIGMFAAVYQGKACASLTFRLYHSSR